MEPGTHKASAAVARDLVAVSLPKFCGYFLRLGATGFGGPIALAGYMQRDLVERRRWVTREDYLEGLALAQLAPGLLAAQLAIYLGYLRAGILGASLVGLAFIGPSFLMVLAIASANVLLWRALMDAARILRNWCWSSGDHRPVCVEAGANGSS
jgi:hypothetical protein